MARLARLVRGALGGSQDRPGCCSSAWRSASELPALLLGRSRSCVVERRELALHGLADRATSSASRSVELSLLVAELRQALATVSRAAHWPRSQTGCARAAPRARRALPRAGRPPPRARPASARLGRPAWLSAATCSSALAQRLGQRVSCRREPRPSSSRIGLGASRLARALVGALGGAAGGAFVLGAQLLQLGAGGRLGPTRLGQTSFRRRRRRRARRARRLRRRRRWRAAAAGRLRRPARADSAALQLFLDLAHLARPVGQRRLALVADGFERSVALGRQQQAVHRQHGPGRRVGGQAARQPTMRLARGVVARQHDDALEKRPQQQVDRPNARRELARQPDDWQVVQHACQSDGRAAPLARDSGRARPERPARRAAIGLLAGGAQALGGLGRARRRLARWAAAAWQASARARGPSACAGQRVGCGLELGQLLLEPRQAGLAVAAARLVDREVGLQRLQVLGRCAPGALPRREWRGRRPPARAASSRAPAARPPAPCGRHALASWRAERARLVERLAGAAVWPAGSGGLRLLRRDRRSSSAGQAGRSASSVVRCSPKPAMRERMTARLRSVPRIWSLKASARGRSTATASASAAMLLVERLAAACSPACVASSACASGSRCLASSLAPPGVGRRRRAPGARGRSAAAGRAAPPGTSRRAGRARPGPSGVGCAASARPARPGRARCWPRWPPAWSACRSAAAGGGGCRRRFRTRPAARRAAAGSARRSSPGRSPYSCPGSGRRAAAAG